MAQNNTTLTILSTKIRQDTEGRFCLNDCHRASGGEKAKQPANFMRLDSTKALIGEIFHSSDLRSDPFDTVNGGVSPGTYAVKELVYAYAMWINPAFHLAVIRAFDAMHGAFKPTLLIGRTRAKPVDRTFRQFFNIAKTIGLDDNQATLKAGAVAKKLCGLDVLQLMEVESLAAPRDDHTMTPRQIGKELGRRISLESFESGLDKAAYGFGLAPDALPKPEIRNVFEHVVRQRNQFASHFGSINGHIKYIHDINVDLQYIEVISLIAAGPGVLFRDQPDHKRGV